MDLGLHTDVQESTSCSRPASRTSTSGWCRSTTSTVMDATLPVEMQQRPLRSHITPHLRRPRKTDAARWHRRPPRRHAS